MGFGHTQKYFSLSYSFTVKRWLDISKISDDLFGRIIEFTNIRPKNRLLGGFVTEKLHFHYIIIYWNHSPRPNTKSPHFEWHYFIYLNCFTRNWFFWTPIHSYCLYFLPLLIYFNWLWNLSSWALTSVYKYSKQIRFFSIIISRHLFYLTSVFSIRDSGRVRMSAQ